MNELNKAIQTSTSTSPWFLSEDAKKFLIYPYVPNIMEMLGLSSGNNSKNNNQNEEAEKSYVYIPTGDSVAKAMASLGSAKPVDIDFDIYYKQMIICGYPKCQNPQEQTGKSNGTCGLEELLKTPITLNPGFDFEEEIKKRKISTAGKEAKKIGKKLLKGLTSIKDAASDYLGNLKDANIGTKDALNMFYGAAQDIFPLINQLPTECLVNALNDGKNMICSVSREAQNTSALDDFASVAKHKLEMGKILAKNTKDAVAASISKPLKDVKSIGKNVCEAIGDLYANTKIYSLCQKRFKNHIQDTVGGKIAGAAEGVKNLYQDGILATVNKVVDNCFTKGQADVVINNLNALTQAEKNQFNDVLNSGNLTNLNDLMQKNQNLADKFGGGEIGFNFNAFQQAAAFDPNLLMSTKLEFVKKLNPLSIVGGMESKFSDPQFLIDTALSASKSTNIFSSDANPFQMGENIISQFNSTEKSILKDALEGELPNLMKSIGGSESKQEISQDVIKTLQALVTEKNKIYMQLNGGKSVLSKDK